MSATQRGRVEQILQKLALIAVGPAAEEGRQQLDIDTALTGPLRRLDDGPADEGQAVAVANVARRPRASARSADGHAAGGDIIREWEQLDGGDCVGVRRRRGRAFGSCRPRR